MVIAHRNAPVGHCAIRVSGADFGECLIRFRVLKRVQQGQGAIELLLRCGATGDWKIDLSKLLCAIVLVSHLRAPDSNAYESDENSKKNGFACLHNMPSC